ncbi:hypothetical protein RHOSPDRAFT_25478, partial [Rhodotorula sp. JG-1b]
MNRNEASLGKGGGSGVIGWASDGLQEQIRSSVQSPESECIRRDAGTLLSEVDREEHIFVNSDTESSLDCEEHLVPEPGSLKAGSLPARAPVPAREHLHPNHSFPPLAAAPPDPPLRDSHNPREGASLLLRAAGIDRNARTLMRAAAPRKGAIPHGFASASRDIKLEAPYSSTIQTRSPMPRSIPLIPNKKANSSFTAKSRETKMSRRRGGLSPTNTGLRVRSRITSRLRVDEVSWTRSRTRLSTVGHTLPGKGRRGSLAINSASMVPFQYRSILTAPKREGGKWGGGMLHRVADRQNLPYFCSKELHVGESLPAVPLSTLKVSFMPGTGKLDGAIPTPTAHQLDSFLYSVEPPSVALDAGNSGQQLLSQVTTVVPHATRCKVAGSTRSQEGCLGNIGKGA